ncbi:hypothetical protein [Rhizobium sp. Leaf306]|uniref:hypothetical protein n=1 Tax=Rhizobium sp. Leaf306 TaxID=1736330 RepID=UPI0012E93914|nr:hypothetical protein [Rhizobium sp. Leaf306]
MAVAAYASDFGLDFVVSSPLPGRPASCGGTATFVEDVSEHVVGDIGHADLHLGSADSDRSDEELHLVSLLGKDMLPRQI